MTSGTTALLLNYSDLLCELEGLVLSGCRCCAILICILNRGDKGAKLAPNLPTIVPRLNATLKGLWSLAPPQLDCREPISRSFYERSKRWRIWVPNLLRTVISARPQAPW